MLRPALRCVRADDHDITATDPERAAFFTSTRLTDSDPCARDQHGRLLLLRLGRYFRSPTQQTIQSVLDAAARLIFSTSRSDHTTPLLREFHWLRIPERIQFRLCVLSYRCLHGTAPSYLDDSLRRCADTEGRRRLRSSITDTLVVPLTNRSTLGDRAFPVAASRAWNGLPASIRTATSLYPFRRQLKTLLYRQSFC